jgi:hypothetical protein
VGVKFEKKYWPCLAMTEHNRMCTILIIFFSSLFYILHFSITINIKTFPLFSLFISHQYFFIIIQIKKFTIIQNFFTFLYKSFYFISHHHFLLISKLTINYSVLYKHLPNIPIITNGETQSKKWFWICCLLEFKS